MLRPEQLQLSRPPRAGQPEARVIDVTFYGPGARVHLALQAGETTELIARVPGHMVPMTGETVGITVTGEATAFPRGPAGLTADDTAAATGSTEPGGAERTPAQGLGHDGDRGPFPGRNLETGMAATRGFPRRQLRSRAQYSDRRT